MNRLVLILLLISMMVINAYSQIKQVGYVKTRAKKNSPSKYIPNAIIKADEAKNKAKSDSTGRFVIVFPKKNEGESFSLKSITKKGYELVDYDLIGQSLAFSTSVPLKILMEPEGTMLAELKESEQYVKTKVREKRNNDYAQLEHRLELGEISETAFYYDSILIENEYCNNMHLVASMSKKYAMYDYDSTDSVTTKVYDYIDNGDLAQADQMIFEQTQDYATCLAMRIEKPNSKLTGPRGTSYNRVNSNSADIWKMRFVKRLRTTISVHGDGDTILELYVFRDDNTFENSKDNLLAYDEGKDCEISFVPPYTGNYKIIVRNTGGVYNQYTINDFQ